MPFVPAGASGEAGEDQVDDVVGQIVVTVGDEDLGAEQAIGAVGGPRRAW